MIHAIKNTVEIIRHSALIALVTLLLSILACGGGDGGGNLPPSAGAGPDRFVMPQAPVTILGSGTDSDGAIATYNWTQIDSPAVIVSGANTPTLTFTAPDTGLLKFRLTVSDNKGATASDDVTVSVANVLFSEDFDDVLDGNQPLNWNWYDDSDYPSEYSSYWQVVDGKYIQQNVVESINSFEQSYHLGTYSFLNSEFDWTNYRFSVEVTPLPNNAEDVDRSKGNDVGVMFRYNTYDDNYYRLTLNSRYGFSRLEKKFDGIFSTLAVDSAGYYEGEMLNITIELNDSLIQVFLNDDPLFSVFDSDINSGTIALYCQDKAKFDNVLVTENSPVPTVVISSPVAYSIATTDIDNTLDVSAIATNVPSGGKVEFVLDDTESIELSESSSHYTAEFTGVSRGEHTVHAILRDSSGTELARDTNVQIGVLGDYYVAIGDSITNGIGDADPSDNTSQDGRIIAIQGFEANLNDLLTSTRDYPHIVFNEGIGGDTSAKALGRIESILMRHPGSNKVLILLGTNDATSIPVEDFRTNMEALVDAIPSGKTIWVALIPPIFDEDGKLDVAKNVFVEDYNDVINQLDIQVGPNLYDFFSTRPFLFADKLHPNAHGYEAMAYLWHNELNETQLTLPSYP